MYHTKFTSSLVTILPFVLSLVLGGILSIYGSRSELGIDFCLVIYGIGIIVGILDLLATYRLSALMMPDSDSSQPQICSGNVVLASRICLVIILLLVIVVFGFVLHSDAIPSFMGQTYSIYMIGFILGLCLSGLTFEFQSVYHELQKFFCTS